jgi:cobalt-precorrin 5A hydrolase
VAAGDAGGAVGGGEAMAVIGIGTTSRASIEDVIAAIEAARAKAVILKAPPQKLAALNRPAFNPAIESAAVRCGIDLILLTADALRAAAPRCVTQSKLSMKHYGVPSVAEAAALAAAGPGSKLIVSRFFGPNTTASVAAQP